MKFCSVQEEFEILKNQQLKEDSISCQLLKKDSLQTNLGKIKFTRKIYLINKRFVDILFSIFGLVILLFASCLLKLIYCLNGDFDPLFYQQERVGQNGRIFKLYKFRTMLVNADAILDNDAKLYQEYVANDYKLPFKRDPRITKVGYFLRKWSLDELPQFWNILKGDMSLIGPRPLVLPELQNYQTFERVKLLLSVKPGILGYWQASGRSNIGYPERCALELFYAQNFSFGFDIKIFFKNIIVILKHIGAY